MALIKLCATGVVQTEQQQTMMANSMFLEAASKIVFAAGKSKTDALKVRRYPIFVTLSLRVECSPKGSHSILALKK